jgi:SAM-dependent methyltransferase
MMLTPEELAELPPKARRDLEIVDLYLEHDYLTAYALHTAQRIVHEGYEAAAGADASRDNWDSHGNLQRDFLLNMGLQPHHRLLEVGCGAGRLARKIVPYLGRGQYHGVDLSEAAVESAIELSVSEGWSHHDPQFYVGQVADLRAGSFQFAWAHSVTTHLPPTLITNLFSQVAAAMVGNGVFYWTYLPAERDERYGLTQFRTTVATLRRCAEDAGLTFDEVPDWVRLAGYKPGRWSYGQSIAVSRRA